jgi:titin
VTPTGLTASLSGNGVNRAAVVKWASNSLATSYTLQRATNAGFTTGLTTVNLGNVLTYSDRIGNTTQPYYYRLAALNTVGSGVTGFPSATTTSAFSTSASVNLPTPPVAPSNLAATILSATSIRLNWTDNSNNELNFRIERSVNGGPFTLLMNVGANSVTYTNTGLTSGTSYSYRVAATNAAGTSAFAGPITVVIAVPAAPSRLTATAVRNNILTGTITLKWTDNSNNETGFTLQRATNSGFTRGVTSTTVAANTTTLVQAGLLRGTTYYYRIQAVNGALASANVNATPFPVTIP